MIGEMLCPYCQSGNISLKEVVWVSFNEENEGLVEIMQYCQSCKNEYPVLTEFEYKIIKQKYTF